MSARKERGVETETAMLLGSEENPVALSVELGAKVTEAVLSTKGLISTLLLAAILALPVSICLLKLYRRAVLRSMRAGAKERTADPVLPESSTLPNRSAQNTPDLSVTGHASSVTAGPAAEELHSKLLRAPWRAAAIYAVAGFCYALVMAAAHLASRETGFLLPIFLMLLWVHVWPVVLTIGLVAAATRRARFSTAVGYFFVLAILGAMTGVGSPFDDSIAALSILSFWTLSVTWVIMNLPATVLLLTFLNWRIRAVGPLVLTFMVIAVLGSYLALAVASSDEGLGMIGPFIGLIVLGFAVFGLLGWLALRWIGVRYESKKISDQSVTLDSMWLLFGIVHSLPLISGSTAWILSGLGAFAAYKVVSWAGFSLLTRDTAPENSPRLLLLRVFSLGKRSERLFDALTKHWRHIGSIRLIAGPDLATTTIEPHEFLDFLGGKLARRFIDGPTTLNRRISEEDLEPDRDGRFRVNDFFCHEDTWQMTLSRLVDQSDAVLMDLRGFSRENRGVAYEIEEVINVVPLKRVVLVVDETTDQEFLRQTIQEGWDRMRPTSPNRSSTLGGLDLLRFRGSNGELRPLLTALSNAAKSDTVRDGDKLAPV